MTTGSTRNCPGAIISYAGIGPILPPGPTSRAMDRTYSMPNALRLPPTRRGEPAGFRTSGPAGGQEDSGGSLKALGFSPGAHLFDLLS